ncbi:MAG: hypothetical protein IKN08_04600 [Bacteroidales bacterium]|nr:hypothetical protein [Bacteroidales bacterium]MBR6227799.1 hypothetical protein [Bacteroidales bacterium]
MSAFIVISVKDSLNWIVDDIKGCRPHNPDVITYLSTGKIKKEEEDKYLYEYTVFTKHSGEGNEDNTLAKTIESDTPRNLFSNQIAQFLHVCENEGEQINIFLIDNPITDADFAQSSWLVDEIKAVYESHKATNFQLVRVLFSYEIDKPADVNRQASKMILKHLTKINLDDSGDFLTRILYIDNQNRSGAAMCLNKEEHDIMIPRMLCDFMMLLSNKDDSYNVAAAINGQTRIFAIGYSECMYYHDDVFRYYDLAGKRDLIQYLLETKNTEESLDYDKHPIGLEDRVKRLGPKYMEVPFDLDISSFTSSIDKAIDDIIVSFKDDIMGIRQEALAVAAEEDAEETKKRQIAYLKESKKLPEDLTDEDLGMNYNSIAEQYGVDISGYVVSDATQKANKEYPDYIDRHQIYEEHLLEKEEEEDFEGTVIEDNIVAYENLVCYIQKKPFKNYVKRQCELANSRATAPNVNSQGRSNLGCFFKRLFCGKRVSEENKGGEQVPPNINRDWHTLKECINSIHGMYAERKDYYLLEKKVAEMKKELQEMSDAVSHFKLTSHCSSVDNLIDLDKLREYHDSGRVARIDKIVDKWDSRQEENKSYDAFFDDLKEQTKWDVYDLYYINWSDPFDFIKSIDLQKVCESLKRRSQPYVYTYTLGPNAENLTSFNFYTDNPMWHEDISQKRVSLRDDNKASSTFSHHICSKICMFQFLQMTHELVEGLVDCFEETEQ